MIADDIGKPKGLDEQSRAEMIKVVKTFDPALPDYFLDAMTPFELQIKYNAVVLGSYRVVRLDKGWMV